jgi:ribosomal protein S18 acetylase RimI-like enzyme
MVEIVGFSEENKEYVKKLNFEWLNKYFKVEPNDFVQLNDPQGQIIDKGGEIFFAKHNNEIVGTVSLIRVSDEEYELGKMAVTEGHQGLGIGKVLIEKCISRAMELKLKKLTLYSNTSLITAINLYKKYGFIEVNLNPGYYERANIKMDLIF